MKLNYLIFFILISSSVFAALDVKKIEYENGTIIYIPIEKDEEIIHCKNYTECEINSELEGCSYNECNYCCDNICNNISCETEEVDKKQEDLIIEYNNIEESKENKKELDLSKLLSFPNKIALVIIVFIGIGYISNKKGGIFK